MSMLGRASKFFQLKMSRARAEKEDGVSDGDVRLYEHPDPKPMQPPVGYRREPHIWEQQRAFIRSELSRMAEAEGMETFEESDDFDVGDDLDPSTPYEADFDPPSAEVQKAFAPAPESAPSAQPAVQQATAAPAAPPTPALATAPVEPPKAP